MKGNSPAGKRRSVRGGFFVVLLRLSFLTLTLNIHALASICGFSQCQLEFQAIFNDPRLLKSLNGHLMTSVTNDGYKFVIKTENGGVISGSMRDIPLPKGMFGSRSFQISKLGMESGLADKAINPRNGEPTSATRLQDFKNLLENLDDTHDAKFRANSITKIVVLGTKMNIFRISNSCISMDIHFTPTVYTPPEDQHSGL